MNEQTIKDPQGISINTIPAGITTYRKTPIVAIFVVFIGIVVYLIFNMSNKQMVSRKQHAKRQDHKQASAKAALNANTMTVSNDWFHDEKYNDIRPAYSIENTADSEDIVSTVTTTKATSKERKPSEKLSEEDKKLIRDFSKEEFKTKLEVYQLEQRTIVSLEKARIEAIRSPAKIAVNNKNIFQQSSLEGEGTDSKYSIDKTLLQGQQLAALQSQISNNNDPNMQTSKQQFLKEKFTVGKGYLNSTKQAAISPYEIKAGTMIPAALIAGVNSDLPGNVIAQVRENIYDSVTGNYLLIPQGTRIIGKYDSRVSFGQNRALVVWTRLIFPDGASLSLENMQGVDVSGYAGLHDKVNNHYFRIYGNALLLSLVGAGYELLINDSVAADTEDTVAAAVGKQLTQVATETLRKNLDIQPTIIIRPGYKFNVLVMKDVILERL